MAPFDCCWQRIERAETHSGILAKAWNSFIEAEPYGVALDIETDGNGRIRVWPHVPFPDEFALELGEMLYQFRAALDGCAYAAATIETGKIPPPNERLLSFPLCDSANAFKSASRSIRPLPQRLKAIIESVQPYNAPKNLAPELMVLNVNRALGILNDWAKIDRHRKLHVIGSWASNVKPRLRLPHGVTVKSMTVSNGGFLEDEREVASFVLTGYEAGMDVKGNPDLSIDIAVNEPPPPCADNDTFGNRVKLIMAAVKSIVNAFEEAFKDLP